MEHESLPSLIERADHLYNQGRLSEALSIYSAITAQDATVAWAHNRIGAILAQTGEKEQAEQALRKALELDPTLSQAHSNLGNLLYARGDYEAALSKYQEAIALNPGNPVFHENVHAAYKKLGKLAEAVTALKQANRLTREAAKAEAKDKFNALKSTGKARLGCLGVVTVSALFLILLYMTFM